MEDGIDRFGSLNTIIKSRKLPLKLRCSLPSSYLSMLPKSQKKIKKEDYYSILSNSCVSCDFYDGKSYVNASSDQQWPSHNNLQNSWDFSLGQSTTHFTLEFHKMKDVQL